MLKKIITYKGVTYYATEKTYRILDQLDAILGVIVWIGGSIALAYMLACL